MQEVVTACWNTIGVHGDSSCAELKQAIHCRNCPVYSQAATKLLDGEPPAEYLAHWTEQARRTKNVAERKTVSVLIFRIGSEWFALQAAVLTEIANLRPIHSLPHRRNGIVLGIASIRGELIVCVSLRGILSVDAQDTEAGNRRDGVGRMLVMQREGACAVCPVDEVHGMERFVAQDLGNLPATVGGAAARYTCATLAWAGRTVGVLDERMLFQAIARSIA